MAKYASIKRRPKEEAPPSPKTIAHNQRYNEIADLLPKEHREENWHDTIVSNATKTFNKWKRENEVRYKKKRGRQLGTNAHKLESLAIILSAEQVGKCDPVEIWAKAQVFKAWFEDKYKTTVRTMDWHRDEGKILLDGTAEINEHIHVEYDNVNEDGKMVRRLFSKGDLITFQDKIAEIYKPLGFIRGEDTVKKHRHDTPKRGSGQKRFKAGKKAEALKELQTAYKSMRLELKQEQALRPAYALLEATNKSLKDDIIDNNTSAAEAIKKLQKLDFEHNKTKEENAKLRRIRNNEHKRAVDSINQTTDTLRRTTKADISRATKAYQAERGAKEVNNLVEQSASAVIERLESFQTRIRGEVDTELLHKIDQEPKLDIDTVKNFEFKTSKGMTTFDKIVKGKSKEIKQLKTAVKESSLEDSLAVVSKHSSIAEARIIELIDNEIKAKKLDKIEFESNREVPIDDYKTASVAWLKSEKNPQMDDTTEPKERDIKELKKHGLHHELDLISNSLANLLTKIDQLVSDQWKKLKHRPKSDLIDLEHMKKKSAIKKRDL